MKYTLVIIRHAKASSDSNGPDFDRQLTEKGKGDAILMGERLMLHQLIPQLIISSSAKRTRQTAKRIAGETGYNKENLVLSEALYHAPASILEETLYAIDDNIKVCYIVGHNPGITDFVNDIQSDIIIPNMPLCGILAVCFHAQGWNEFSKAKKKVLLFDYPKH